MVEAHQPISELERLPEWKLEFYFRHVCDHLERVAEARKQANGGGNG